MTDHFVFTRRQFLKSAAAAGGLTVIFNALPSMAQRAEKTQPSGSGWMGAPGKARYRIEGLPKVTGQKIYARDFRARDMKGWPTTERQVMLLRATSADRNLLAIDLSMLPPELQPMRVVTAEDLVRDGLQMPSSTSAPAPRQKTFLAALNQVPTYLGQPVALLIFENPSIYREASRLLRFNRQVLQYGPPVPQPTAYAAYSPPTYLTYYSDSKGVQFSQVKNGSSDPYSTATLADKEATKVRGLIQQELKTAGWKTFEATYETQVLDPMFMEPEAGLAWFDRANKRMHLVLGTQSTNGDLSDAFSLFSAHSQGPLNVQTVVLNSCYPGGGFGGRDVSLFPILMLLAATYAEGPVRIAYDRFEQFQGGIKQLGAKMAQTIAVDGQGRLQAVVSQLSLLAGGQNNYSQWVAQLAGYCGGGGYKVPRVAIDALAQPSVGVVAGSMRGFGGPQAFFAVESMMDEIALALRRDPIELREQNALAQGDHSVTGAPFAHPLRLAEICQMARKQELWTQRKEEKAKRQKQGLLYGVGFALTNQAYGTGADGVMAAVEIDAQGALRLTTNCVDMGNGSATSLAISTARYLGTNASRADMGQVEFFDVLGFVNAAQQPQGGNSKLAQAAAAQLPHEAFLLSNSSQLLRRNERPTPERGGSPWDNPHYTKSYSMSSSACITAFQQVHAIEQASRVLFTTGLFPAARKLWGLAPGNPLKAEETRWEDGFLVAKELPRLALADIAARLHADNGVAGAMVHALYQARWVEADYTLEGSTWTWPIDGLCTRQARAVQWQWHERKNVVAPTTESASYGRSLYSPSGALVAVEINPTSGRVQVVEVQTFLDAGRIIQPELVSGQSEGAVAMGIGYALLEQLPLGEGGAGEGNWNLDRYKVALAGDLPLGRLKLNLLPPLPPPEDHPKGIAEAVLCPIAPAIANAVADATQRRFRSLPITPARILESLRS
ncbi:xanthine dehydrogenase family protein molybdopterin-binding subunit [Vitiosangium sp. GDMCC 1.1324]|uniref:xanthine dehydrogenase family protein molybdopterin-binding subunit n=1 Tax=Vitiosangium sp. (strain GDMCC 1.1324) TaxID=2138576 RepID=UPI00130DB677|nr:molybdopterin cofactor-binding domain-containing protein [Vitiosangium sp. GDMCC 1.1324]